MNRIDPSVVGSSIAGNFGRDFTAFDNAAAAVARVTQIYDESVAAIRSAFSSAARGAKTKRTDANYPYAAITVDPTELHVDARLSWGVLLEPGPTARR